MNCRIILGRIYDIPFTNPLYEILYNALTLSLADLYKIMHNALNAVCKVKLSLYQAVEAHRVVRRRDSTFSRQSACRWRWGCQPYAPAALYPPPPRRFMVLIFVTGRVDPRNIVRLKGLGQLKNPMTSGIEPATFRLVEQSPSQLHYRQIPTMWVASQRIQHLDYTASNKMILKWWTWEFGLK
jgi:hypothetical protein